MSQSLNFTYSDAAGAEQPIASGTAFLHGLILTSLNGAATLAIPASEGGDPVITLAVAATNTTTSVMFPAPIPFPFGLYATLTGTGPFATFLYS